jgi:DNA-binding transcriptional MocR family regulator
LRMALAHGVLTGQSFSKPSEGDSLQKLLVGIMAGNEEGRFDQSDQYSPPMGRPDLQKAFPEYYQPYYAYEVSPDDITVTLVATEAFALAMRTIGSDNISIRG